MTKKIEWNSNHQNGDEQELEFRLKFLTWPAQKRWDYLMELFHSGREKTNKKSKRRIEWK